MKIALLGAESTGKTELGIQLQRHFQAKNRSVQRIREYLRTWCDVENRTPRKEEQLAIAAEQVQQMNSVCNSSQIDDILIADTTALTVAAYSDLLFNDSSLYDMALANQRNFDVTLLMGLDLPWVADGIQRDGEHMRQPVDSTLRNALNLSGIAFQVVYGTGNARLQNALRCLGESFSESGDRPQRLRHWICERCSDPVCEHRLFRDLLNKS